MMIIFVRNFERLQSLNYYGTDSSAEQIAYVLYCDKRIIFEDGTVWTNPDFDSWRSTYEGKKAGVKVLNNYYPYEQKITFDGKTEAGKKNSPKVLYLDQGKKKTIKVTYPKDYKKGSLTFKSAKTSIASVNKNGEVTARKAGHTIVSMVVRAKDGEEVIDEIKIVVNTPDLLKKIKVSSKYSVRKGKSQTIKIKMPSEASKVKKYTDKSNQVVFTFASNNKKVAAINSKGKITGKKKGAAVITVTAKMSSESKKTFKVKVTVK